MNKSLFFKKYVMVIVAILLFVFFSILAPNFCTANNISGMLSSGVAGAFLSLSGMFILITNEFDLSLGYNLCFTMIVGAYAASKGWGLIPVIILMIVCGSLVGFLNGVLVVKLNITSFIVTLSVGLALSGLSQAISDGGVIYITEPAGLMSFAKGQIGQNGIGYCVIFFLIFAVLMHLMLTSTRFGRYLYAVGVSKRISFMAGVKTDKVRIISFTCSGFFASLGAIVNLGQLGSASSTFGNSLLLPAYAVVFLSSTAFKPGYINLPGVLLSILIITFGSNGIQMAGAPTWASYIFQGAILCFAMWLSTKFHITHTVRKDKNAGTKAPEKA